MQIYFSRFIQCAALVFLICSVTSCSSILYENIDAKDFQPGTNLVPDEDTAVQVGEAVLSTVYGKRKIMSERPFRGILSNGVWYVRGSLPWFFKTTGGKGGVAAVQISMENGCILHIEHGK